MSEEEECNVVEVSEDSSSNGEGSDSEDDFSCLHEKFITKSEKKSELKAEGNDGVLDELAMFVTEAMQLVSGSVDVGQLRR